MDSPPTSKRHIVCFGTPIYADSDYVSIFKNSYEVSIIKERKRTSTVSYLPQLIAEKGPIDAVLVGMDTEGYGNFDASLLSVLTPHCKIITSTSAGYDEFDINWMNEQGILFCNSVDAVVEATADLAIFLTLAVVRNTGVAERTIRKGKWRHGLGGCLVPAKDPMGMKLGIIGMGAIGKALAKKATVFNLKVQYYNRNRLPATEERKYNATYCSSLQDLLATSDIISLHCPLNENTSKLISTKEFATMKDGAFLVNTSRGAVIDEDALKVALQSGKIARAGLDVLCNEPNVDPWFFEQDNVVLLPHMGGMTEVSFRKAERECFENIKAFFEIGKANSPVNVSALKK